MPLSRLVTVSILFAPLNSVSGQPECSKNLPSRGLCWTKNGLKTRDFWGVIILKNCSRLFAKSALASGSFIRSSPIFMPPPWIMILILQLPKHFLPPCKTKCTLPYMGKPLRKLSCNEPIGKNYIWV